MSVAYRYSSWIDQRYDSLLVVMINLGLVSRSAHVITGHHWSRTALYERLLSYANVSR